MKFMIPEWNNKTSCLPFSKNFSHITVKKEERNQLKPFFFFCWATRTRTKKNRTRICCVTITP